MIEVQTMRAAVEMVRSSQILGKHSHAKKSKTYFKGQLQKV